MPDELWFAKIRIMKKSARSACLIMLVASAMTLPAAADSLDQIGVTALRMVATNVDGGGIRVAQPEASAPTFEVNPSTVGQPTSLFTYASSVGTATTFTNDVGVES